MVAWRRASLEGAALLKRLNIRCGIEPMDTLTIAAREDGKSEKHLRREFDARVKAKLDAAWLTPKQAQKLGAPDAPGGIRLREKVPQAHKVALTDLPAGTEVVRYGDVIGRAVKDLPAGSWVNERVLEMPAAPALSNHPPDTPEPPARGPP